VLRRRCGSPHVPVLGMRTYTVPCPRPARVVCSQNDVVTGTQLSASSPDEEAFVCAVELFGYKFLGRSKDTISIDVAGRGRLNFRVVCMLAYTQVCECAGVDGWEGRGVVLLPTVAFCEAPSVRLRARAGLWSLRAMDRVRSVAIVARWAPGAVLLAALALSAARQMRKMMSLIVEDLQPDEGRARYYLYSKGADSTLFAKLRGSVAGLTPAQASARAEALRLTEGHLR
jgi:hypothetical protein